MIVDGVILSQNDKPIHILKQLRFTIVHIFDIVCHSAFLCDFFEKFFYLFSLAVDVDFDGSIGEVFGPAYYIKSLGDVFYGVAESDALHAPLEDSSFRNHDVVLSDFLLGEKTDIRFYSFVT